MSTIVTKTYSERAAAHAHSLARQCLELMDRKRSNLCVSVDVTRKAAFLKIVEAVAPFVALVKASLLSL